MLSFCFKIVENTWQCTVESEGDSSEAEGCEHDRIGKPWYQPWGTLHHECLCSVVDGSCSLLI